MKVHFVNYGRFGKASGIHIFHLANHLEGLGVRCTVFLPRDPESVHVFGQPRFEVRTFLRAGAALIRRDGTGPTAQTLIHAWTPRKSVRTFTGRLARRHSLPYIVHLEDNETFLRSRAASGASILDRIRSLLGGSRFYASPPEFSGFIRGAAAMTCVNEQLLEFKPHAQPGLTFWPACEPAVFDLAPEPDAALRARLGVAPEEFLIVYPGNVHRFNHDDVAVLYEAVAGLCERGVPVRLLRTGVDRVDVAGSGGNGDPRWLLRVRIADRHIPRYLAAADALVQPGADTPYNKYRFPSKLPMFLASGRPVVLGCCPLRDHVTDGRDCLVLRRSDAAELAQRLAMLVASPELRKTLGINGRDFARRHFSWERSARKLAGFYESILAAAPAAARGKDQSRR